MRIKNSLWIFFSLISFSLYAQQATLKGRIVDARGQNIREIADVFINTGQLKQRLKSNPDGTFTVTIPARRVVTCIVEVNGNHEDRHTLKLQPGQAYTVVIKLGLTSPSAPLATAPPPTTTAPKTERAAPALRPTHERATASVPDKVSVPDKPVPSVGIMEQAEALISGSITDAAGRPLEKYTQIVVNTGQGKLQTTTGAGGKFILKVPANQVLSWAVKAPGFVEQRKTLKLQPRDNYQLNVRLDKALADVLSSSKTGPAKPAPPSGTTRDPSATAPAKPVPPPAASRDLSATAPAKTNPPTPVTSKPDPAKARTTANNATAVIQGRITDAKGNPLELANAALMGTATGSPSDASGNFRLEVPADQLLVLVVTSVGYAQKQLPLRLSPGQLHQVTVALQEDRIALKEVEVKGNRLLEERGMASISRIEPKSIKTLPSAFGDFNKVLTTLPGVVSNNELSSTYSVRGGNFDENLVYVNGIEVYRPFLVRSGQQEGLSFVNPDLVQSIEFSSGGWEAKYGDKLSSVLNVQYKNPAKNRASLTAGLLGGAAHVELGKTDSRVSFVGGVRQKRSQYLLNTLEVKGEYLPRFTDAQGYTRIILSKNKTKPGAELGILFSYARNRYLTRPSSRTTTFGTMEGLQKLFVAFDGEEKLNYEMSQGGIRFTGRPGDRLTLHFIASGMRTSEQEEANVNGSYRLCDLNRIPGDPDPCKENTIGIGSDFQFARNRFRATVLGFENRSIWEVNTRNRIEWGAKAGWEQIEDVLGEAVLSDSAGTMTVNSQATAHNQLSTQRFSGYLQHTFSPNNQHRLTYGARMGYWTLNGQWLVSPTLQYAFQPDWEKEVVFKFAAGVYRQPPFYRELRAPSGQLNENLKAQSSLHIIGGAERRLKLWGRDFFLTSEAYYKKLWDVVAYDVENVRLRYYANNNTQAYAFGGDIRLSGEFVKGAESWFSLGILNTKEDLGFDEQGYVRRPTDQRLTASVFFQDHLPGNPTLRVYLNGIYGSGLPFGPPRNLNYRSAFTGPSYRRVDIGFSKIFRFQGNTLESLWIGAEVLNLLGSRNVLSYTWIHDIGGSQYAVPNSLSARFLNARMILKLGRE